MSDKSPLFVSSSQLLAHSIELYTQGDERKYKFVILHLANAIELILKDRVIDLGISIYKGHNTIGIWDAFSELAEADIQVPERPVIELLIDDRNTIQHRFGFPNGDAVFYYLDHVLRFFRRFLSEEYNVDLVEVMRLYVDDKALAVVGLVEENETAVLERLFKLSPESAVIQVFNIIEHKLLELLLNAKGVKHKDALMFYNVGVKFLLKEMVIRGFLKQESVDNFDFLRRMSNKAVHSAHFDNSLINEWRQALDIGEDLLLSINKAAEAGLFDDLELLVATTVQRQIDSSSTEPESTGDKATL
jgi:hypothetical protein